jgi:uncharacterized protein YndB with AHSA1/START domain/DNA-binding transcriptional ArsR family regulator
MDEVFRALADPSRRALLDTLNARNGQNLRELCSSLDMARQSVSKHLAVLEAASLVTTMWRGREKLHYLNVVPINAIAERWLGKYDRQRAAALSDLKTALEQESMSEFVYTTYINTTPERLWQALTDPAFTRRYWGGAALESTWQVGAKVRWQDAIGEEMKDLGQVVLEAQPYRRLSYTWHNYQPEHAEYFGWTEEQMAEVVKERRSKVTFDIEPLGGSVRLTVIHDGFESDTLMLQAVSGRLRSGGWPELISSLKSLLETGEPLPAADDQLATQGS